MPSASRIEAAGGAAELSLASGGRARPARARQGTVTRARPDRRAMERREARRIGHGSAPSRGLRDGRVLGRPGPWSAHAGDILHGCRRRRRDTLRLLHRLGRRRRRSRDRQGRGFAVSPIVTGPRGHAAPPEGLRWRRRTSPRVGASSAKRGLDPRRRSRTDALGEGQGAGLGVVAGQRDEDGLPGGVGGSPPIVNRGAVLPRYSADLGADGERGGEGARSVAIGRPHPGAEGDAGSERETTAAPGLTGDEAAVEDEDVIGEGAGVGGRGGGDHHGAASAGRLAEAEGKQIEARHGHIRERLVQDEDARCRRGEGDRQLDGAHLGEGEGSRVARLEGGEAGRADRGRRRSRSPCLLRGARRAKPRTGSLRTVEVAGGRRGSAPKPRQIRSAQGGRGGRIRGRRWRTLPRERGADTRDHLGERQRAVLGGAEERVDTGAERQGEPGEGPAHPPLRPGGTSRAWTRRASSITCRLTRTGPPARSRAAAPSASGIRPGAVSRPGRPASTGRRSPRRAASGPRPRPRRPAIAPEAPSVTPTYQRERRRAEPEAQTMEDRGGPPGTSAAEQDRERHQRAAPTAAATALHGREHARRDEARRREPRARRRRAPPRRPAGRPRPCPPRRRGPARRLPDPGDPAERRRAREAGERRVRPIARLREDPEAHPRRAGGHEPGERPPEAGRARPGEARPAETHQAPRARSAPLSHRGHGGRLIACPAAGLSSRRDCAPGSCRSTMPACAEPRSPSRT